jgi:hypothetical protein
MRSDRDGGPPSAPPPADHEHPKLTVAGRNADGTLKLRVKVPGLLHRFTVSRGEHERPLQFDGEVLGEAEAVTGDASVLRAAIYRTKGGKHVSEFSRRDASSNVTGKAVAFPTLDEAVSWFRPGRLTTSLLKQLGRWDAEYLDESAATREDEMPPTTDELVKLLIEPNETLSAEYKSWLDLRENPGRALLAKAAIALANHGGGIIVLGMRAQENAGPLESMPRPPRLDRYTQDQVNQSINRFAEPEFHCELSFAAHPSTKVEHAFVSVPGGMTVPVFTSRACDGVIAARKCYIRKPGPRSEEAFDAQEWNAVLERCVRARREDMLDAIRAIVLGSAGSVLPPSAVVGEKLTAFTQATRQRWNSLVANLPEGDSARFPHGHYELGFEILSAKPLASLTELRSAMQQASAVKHTGWGPFALAHRAEFEPRIADGAIEAWFGPPVERLLGRDPAHVDYWRANEAGRLVLLRGYEEDGQPNRKPGTCFDITLPVWRVGEAILYVGRLAELFGDELSFLVRCRYLGLRGRVLTHLEGRRMLFEDRRCADYEVVLERQITRAQARDNLVEVLHALLKPLYERFAFFELSEQLVAEEVERMTRNRF